MNPSRPNLSRTLLTLGCAFALTLLAAPVAHAAGTATLQPLSDKAPALPLTATFEKTDAVPPYVLKLKNDSKAAIKVSGKVLLSVVHHAMDKARPIPAHVIEPGQVWSIGELAALDKVILSSEGHADLELAVPGHK